MTCYKCQYYNSEGKLCGLGKSLNFEVVKTGCEDIVRGKFAKFKGEIHSIWDYEANPRTLEQLPRAARTIGGYPVIHYSHTRKREGAYFLMESIVVARVGEDRIDREIVTSYISKYILKQDIFRASVIYQKGYLIYSASFYPHLADVLAKHKLTKNKRKDKARLDGISNRCESIPTVKEPVIN